MARDDWWNSITVLYLGRFHFRGVGPLWYWFFAIFGTLPVTMIGGTVVGAIVWMVTSLLRTTKLTGAIVGAIIAAIIGGAIGLIFDAQEVQTMGDLFFVEYGAIAGAVVGLVSGADDHTKQS